MKKAMFIVLLGCAAGSLLAAEADPNAVVKEVLGRLRRGGQSPEPIQPKGWVKFWIKDGALVKYEFNVQARVLVGQDEREVEINRTTTVELKDVGKTQVAVSDEAKKKLL